MSDYVEFSFPWARFLSANYGVFMPGMSCYRKEVNKTGCGECYWTYFHAPGSQSWQSLWNGHGKCQINYKMNFMDTISLLSWIHILDILTLE